MVKKKSHKKVYVFLVVIIFVLVLLVFIFSFRAYQHYGEFRSHRAYFRQPNPEVQSWMTIHSVVNQFNISQDVLLKELNVSMTVSTYRLTIEDICQRNNLNCTAVIGRINNLRRS